MLAPIIVVSTLVSSSIAALLPSAVEPSDSRITPGPQIELLKRQNDQRYMGWVADKAGAWSTEICDFGAKYYQDASRWGCCETTRTDCGEKLAVDCVNGNMIYRATASGSSSLTNSFVTRACTSIWTASTDRSFSLCNTAYMFENERDSNSKVNIVCGVSSLDWTYYRTAPVAATETSSTRARTASFSLPGRASLIPTSIPTTIIPSNDSPSDFSTGRKSKSKAWIAGAVVGPILGLAIIGLAACFFIRRKKNKSRNQTVAPATGGMPPPGATAYQQNTYPTKTDPTQLPQYYPNMEQNAAAAPLGATKQDGYYGPGATPQSPVTSQEPQSPYGAAPQQWQQHGAQPVYGAPSPSMSPAPQNVQSAQYVASEGRPFSSELEGNHAYVQPQNVNVQPPK